MLNLWSHTSSYIVLYYFSPLYSRSSITPLSNAGTMQFFSSSPTHDGSHIWSSNTIGLAAPEDYTGGTPKGSLPAFQRITSNANSFTPTHVSRTNQYTTSLSTYGSQVSVHFSALCPTLTVSVWFVWFQRGIHGPITTILQC